MATVTEIVPRTLVPEPTGDPCVVMRGVGWAGSEILLQLRDDRRRPVMIYLDGDVALVPPVYAHETLANRLRSLVLEVAVGLDLPCKMAGGPTFNREKDDDGAEADASFYLASVDKIVGKKTLDLNHDPAPNLVIEAVNTHHLDKKIKIWSRFGVSEVWVIDRRHLQFLVLQPYGRYEERDTSPSFPFFTASEIFGQVANDLAGEDTGWTRAVRAWVAGPLAERVRAGRNEPTAPPTGQD